MVEIFTDGSCPRNPGPGGWACIIRYKDVERELVGYEADTTNNRMELMGVIAGLSVLNRSCTVTVTTDSQYVQKGISEWIKAWKTKRWINSNGEPVKNKDLWVILDKLSDKHSITWTWTRGHVGHPENERCDTLAREQVDKRHPELRKKKR